jgi:hypothetical protein
VRERFKVRGDIGKGQRTVTLQKRDDGHWRTVRRSSTGRGGRYEFLTSTRQRSLTLRVRAPRQGRRPAVITKTRVVRTLRDKALLELAGTIEQSTAVATLAPARQGRKVTLQLLDDSTWRAAAPTTTQAADGTSVFDLPGPGTGPLTYRVRVAAWKGAPAYTSTPVIFTPRSGTWAVPSAPVPLTIETEGGAPILDRENYVPGTMELEGVDHSLQIRGRGNTTWHFEKKPYRIKLTTQASLLGMPAERDWVLLANWADRTGLRNHLALAFGRERTSLAWTSKAQYVDVTLNGQSLGLYQLVEQVEQSDLRVALPSNGLLLEVDKKAEAHGDPFFTSPHGVPIAYNDPDDLTPEQQAEVQGAVAALEEALYGEDFADPMTGYAAHMDIDSFVDWYLLNEFFKNSDATFNSSVMITWIPGGAFTMGPPWDFDLSAGSAWEFNTPPGGWYVRYGEANWYVRLFEDPAFEARVAARWQQLRPAFESLTAQIPDIVTVLEGSAQADWTMWHEVDDDIGQVHADSYSGEVEFLQNWLTERTEWINEQYPSD